MIASLIKKIKEQNSAYRLVPLAQASAKESFVEYFNLMSVVAVGAVTLNFFLNSLAISKMFC